MTKIDHFFASSEWLDIFPRTDLQALVSLGSYHCPLFMQGMWSMISIRVSGSNRTGSTGQAFLRLSKRFGTNQSILRMLYCVFM